MHQKITPCLWFDNQAEEAANFYVSVFKNSKILDVAKYGKSGAEVSKMPEGSVMTVLFELNGQRFMALNGGPLFKFSEAISFMIYCKDQGEIDYFWNKLLEGGTEGPCGWLKDKYGLSWQIIPDNLDELVKTEKGMKAMLEMKKIEIKDLEEANK